MEQQQNPIEHAAEQYQQTVTQAVLVVLAILAMREQYKLEKLEIERKKEEQKQIDKQNPTAEKAKENIDDLFQQDGATNDNLDTFRALAKSQNIDLDEIISDIAEEKGITQTQLEDSKTQWQKSQEPKPKLSERIKNRFKRNEPKRHDQLLDQAAKNVLEKQTNPTTPATPATPATSEEENLQETPPSIIEETPPGLQEGDYVKTGDRGNTGTIKKVKTVADVEFKNQKTGKSKTVSIDTDQLEKTVKPNKKTKPAKQEKELQKARQSINHSQIKSIKI